MKILSTKGVTKLQKSSRFIFKTAYLFRYLTPYPSFEVVRILVENDAETEINLGLYDRYPVKKMRPSTHLLDLLVAEGVTFTMSSDSHYPNDLGIYTDQIKNMLVEKGVKEIETFEKETKNDATPSSE
jgi:histidinol phosphatase-like PHP family hydrolase